MQKKYIVRLTKRERDTLEEVVKKLKGTSQKVRRAQILLKADARGPSWTDSRIAEAFACRRQTVESIRQRFVETGFQENFPRLLLSFLDDGLLFFFQVSEAGLLLQEIGRQFRMVHIEQGYRIL